MQIDTLLTKDKKLQAFLFWAEQKTASVQTKHKTVVIRAFYNYVVIYSYAIALTKPNDSLDFDDFLNFDDSLDFDDFDMMDDATNQCRDLISILAPDFDFKSDLELDLDLNLSCALKRDLDFDLDSELELDFDLAVNCAKYLEDKVFLQSLQLLSDKLPNIEENTKHFSRWWHINGDAWNKELRQICIDQRNVGHDWQFTNNQVELLEQYYSANLLLVDCMNRSYVSKQVREEIESTMLLPRKK